MISRLETLYNNCYTYLPELMNYTVKELKEIIKLNYSDTTGTINGIIKVSGKLDITIGKYNATIIDNHNDTFYSDLKTVIVDNKDLIIQQIKERRLCQNKKQK